MGRGLYGQKIIQDWVCDKKRPRIKTQEDLFRNRKYIFDLKRAKNKLSQISVMNYFLLKELHIQECRTMMNSAHKQRNFCYATMKDLEIFAITPEWTKVFDLELKKIFRRIDHLILIMKDNLQLTPYCPYFEQVGFEHMTELVQNRKYESDSCILDILIPEMEVWNAEHAKEVANHMKQVEPSIIARETFLAKQKASEQAEKETAKLIKKAEQEENKIIKKQLEKNAIQQKKIDKEITISVRRSM